jgi:hypothetical protein
MVNACPVTGERYYLCVLLNHVRGATSFEDLKTTGTALNNVHNFFNPVYLHVCGGMSQKLSMLLFWLYLSFCTLFDRFCLFCWYHFQAVVHLPRSEKHVMFAGLLTQMPLLTSVWKRHRNGRYCTL